MRRHDDYANPLYHFFVHTKHKPIHKWHSYFDIYHRHLRRHRACKVSMLEIGLLWGGSLQMWKSYFTPDSEIFGVDNNPACKAHQESRVTVFTGDAADAGFWGGVLAATGPLDVVVDDGGHKATQQINAFQAIYPRMREGGVYIVEDTHTSFWPKYVDTPDGKTFLQFAHQKTEELHAWTRVQDNFDRFGVEPAKREGRIEVSEFCRTTASIHFYDSMVVFEKGLRSEPWYEIIGAGG